MKTYKATAQNHCGTTPTLQNILLESLFFWFTFFALPNEIHLNWIHVLLDIIPLRIQELGNAHQIPSEYTWTFEFDFNMYILLEER